MGNKEVQGRYLLSGLKALRAFMLFAAVLGLALSFLPGKAEGARRDYYWRYPRGHTLTLNVTLTYNTMWGNEPKSSIFSHQYGLGFNGYVLDPRLVSYRAGLRFNQSLFDNGLRRSVGGGDLRISLFNRIRKDRGLKLWRYVPMPITMTYSRYIAKDYTAVTYSMSMYYMRPGYLRVFANRKFLYYDDGIKERNINQNNANRYRVKYNKRKWSNENKNLNGNWNGNGNGNGNWNGNGNGNGNWNGNGNGNGNWNRNGNGNGNWNGNGNGNGNWNRNGNGNGNWNRNGNGNGNWNRNGNGNGNWNRNGNGNGNWNRNGNGNGNWNRNRNWNRNWNQNWNQNWNRLRRKGLFSFRYPFISFDIHRSVLDYKSFKYSSTMGSLRLTVDNPPRKRRGRIIYKSKFHLYYRFMKSNTPGSKHLLKMYLVHSWPHLNMSNDFKYDRVNNFRSYYISSRLGYGNSIKNIVSYGLGLGGSYTRSGDVGTFSLTYTAGLSGTRGFVKRLVIVPGLFFDTRVRVSYRRTEGKDREGRNIYSLYIGEGLTSTQLRRTKLTAVLSSGYTESGVPFSFVSRATSSVFRRVSLDASYSFVTAFPKEGKGRAITERLSFRTNVFLMPTLSLRGGVSRSVSTRKGSPYLPDERTVSITAHGAVVWRISAGSHMEVKGNMQVIQPVRYYSVSGVFRSRVSSRSYIAVHGDRVWNSYTPGFKESLRTIYNFRYRRMTFGVEYSVVRSGSASHSLMVRVSRSFGRAFRRL